ncbi:MAG: alpha/beta fold hydrolase [Brevibacterium aurantiacum]|uniref:Alpha/beta hydrolase n=1 Tax=Brevibacterium aurantiacum TaxID=273384 RepID=A0A2A3YQN6_BREAU|nr:alpha/beta hydrolase [Brevibacterium aurantiacum]MDN5550966.1 alpha/beta hydrolase [Brevibacterium sp.]MDN6371591.1 alpha/beta hydrolase [Brevibacterium aurantiacum]MDN6378908.1 alpha/beta hydrolase [Brevibacterium aurantiacum]PCC41610.1 alpha/beta hydrolase [Brevibacterium aurantiacum]PCC48555.1 alpha/beta hydrolase [Brevibacterium aurantiacum]
MDSDNERRTRPWLLRPRVLVPMIAALSIAALCGYFLRSPSPVGHWNNAEGEAEFFTAYDQAFESMPEPAETMDVRTSFGVVRVYRFAGTGDASPMLLLPGTASSTPVWADNMPSLLKLGDVYTLDLLGEPGRSIQASPISDAEDEAEWLAEAIAALPEDSVNLIGLSLGGWTAANLAIRHPQHVKTLTLIDPVQTFDGIPVETILRAIPATVPWFPKAGRDAFNSYTAGGIEVEDVPVADMIEAGMHHYSMKKPQPTRITEPELTDLSMPVLAIIAGRSVMHDPETATATARRALGTEAVQVYDDASHALTGEYPDEIAADIGDFITRP